MKKLTAIGFTISAIWVLGFLALALARMETWPSMKLNEWGDFFAGAAAPIALLWLILGYMQQGEELRLNTEALLAQQRELENQVNETSALVASATRQALASEILATATQEEVRRANERDQAETLPRFIARGGRGSATDCMIDVQNDGAAVRRLSINTPPGPVMAIEPTDHFPPGMTGVLVLKGTFSYPFFFELRFIDSHNRERHQKYEMIKAFEFTPIHEA